MKKQYIYVLMRNGKVCSRTICDGKAGRLQVPKTFFEEAQAKMFVGYLGDIVYSYRKLEIPEEET